MIALWLGFIGVWIGTAALLQPDGADFEDAFDDLDKQPVPRRRPHRGVIYGSVVATVFGWWNDVFADDRTTVAPRHRPAPLHCTRFDSRHDRLSWTL